MKRIEFEWGILKHYYSLKKIGVSSYFSMSRGHGTFKDYVFAYTINKRVKNYFDVGVLLNGHCFTKRVYTKKELVVLIGTLVDDFTKYIQD